jgi:hypothetical protein
MIKIFLIMINLQLFMINIIKKIEITKNLRFIYDQDFFNNDKFTIYHY